MKDFTKIIPKQGQEEWPNKLGLMGALFHQAEYQMVKNKFRQAAIINVDHNNLPAILEQANKDGLLLTPLNKIAITDRFTAITQSPGPGEPFIWRSCITRTRKDGEKFKQADAEHNHRIVGQMLGYPECCIDYFIQTFPIDHCPIWVDLRGSVSGYPECNGMLRYFGPKITAHLSCSPACKATKEIGKVWLKTMQGINKDLADELYRLLASPITWDSYHGVVQIETPYFIGLNNALFILKKPRIINWRAINERQKIKISSKKKLKSKKI